MANFNKIFLMGNLTRDPQLSYLPSQTAVVDFGLAVNRRWTGKDGEKKESTCFVDCRAFSQQAETINKYLSKGKPIFIEGRLDFDTWTSQDGSKRSKHRVTVERFQFIGQASADEKARSAPQQGGAGQGPQAGAQADDFGGDDIPF